MQGSAVASVNPSLQLEELQADAVNFPTCLALARLERRSLHVAAGLMEPNLPRMPEVLDGKSGALQDDGTRRVKELS